MATYLEFFELQRAPFETGSKGRLILGTPALRDALTAIKKGLRDGSPRICVSGGPGVGKTSLALALPRVLGDSVRVIQIRDSRLGWDTQSARIAVELGVAGDEVSREALIAGKGSHPLLVLVIDSAQELPAESLEELDALLALRDDSGRQLLHCVLLADLHGASEGTDTPLLWWLDQLTTLQLEYAPIPAQGVQSYIEKHLDRAGWSGDALFTAEAALAIHRYTGGVPLAIGQLSEQLLVLACERGLNPIGEALVEEVCGESRRSEVDASADSTATRSRRPFFARPTLVDRVRTQGQSRVNPFSSDESHEEPSEPSRESHPRSSELPGPRASRRAATWLTLAAAAAALVGAVLFALWPEAETIDPAPHRMQPRTSTAGSAMTPVFAANAGSAVSDPVSPSPLETSMGDFETGAPVAKPAPSAAPASEVSKAIPDAEPALEPTPRSPRHAKERARPVQPNPALDTPTIQERLAQALVTRQRPETAATAFAVTPSPGPALSTTQPDAIAPVPPAAPGSP